MIALVVAKDLLSAWNCINSVTVVNLTAVDVLCYFRT